MEIHVCISINIIMDKSNKVNVFIVKTGGVSSPPEIKLRIFGRETPGIKSQVDSVLKTGH